MNLEKAKKRHGYVKYCFTDCHICWLIRRVEQLQKEVVMYKRVADMSYKTTALKDRKLY